MNLQFSSLLLLVSLACSSVFGLVGPEKNTVHTGQKRSSLFDIPPLLTDLFSLDPLADIIQGFDANPEINAAFPGLRKALTLVKGETITAEAYCRALLLAVQGHNVYKQAFNDLDPDLQEMVTRYAAGGELKSIVKKRSDFYIPPSPAVKHHFRRMEQMGRTAASRAWLNAKRGSSPVIYEDESQTKSMKVAIRRL